MTTYEIAIVKAGAPCTAPKTPAVAHTPIPWGTTVFVITALVILVTVLLANLTVLVFVLVGVTVVLPSTFLQAVEGGGWDWVLIVVVTSVVEVSVLVVLVVETVVEVTIVMYEAGVLAQRGISYSITTALLTAAAAASRGDRCIFAAAGVVAGGMQLNVVVTVEMTFL